MPCKDEGGDSSSESEYELASESTYQDHIDKLISDTIGVEPTEKSDFVEGADSTANCAINSEELDAENDSSKENEPEENDYSEEELITLKVEVSSLKMEGNELYKSGDYCSAKEVYSKAILLCRRQLNDLRSILHANRAACHLSDSEFKEAEEDCDTAIELNPHYLKAIIRRAQVREKLDKLSAALEDYQKVIQLDPRQGVALQAIQRLPKEIEIQQEKMKEECISKLKDLGNLVLKPFGLSTENFNMVQDPKSGGYNIQFSQNK